jgi:histidinol-phosphate aminotransferase
MNNEQARPGRPRPDIAALSAYVPGRSAEDVRRRYGLDEDEVVKLASNENPFGPSPRAVAAATAALTMSNRYPDGASTALRERLGAVYALAPDNVIVGNGSDEMILLLALAYLRSGDTAVMAAPPYAIHRNAVVIAGGIVSGLALKDHVHDLDAMAAAVGADTKLVFVANPHNPTGTHLERDVLRHFAAQIPAHVLLVVDEAYHDYVDDAVRHTARDLLDDYPNVVTLRTFSKAHGLAGLRAGYALAHEDVVGILDRIRPPFDLNIAAQAAALAALDDDAHVRHVARENRAGRARLRAIARCHGLTTVPSETNFVLMQVDDSVALTEALMARGVIVRPGENLGMPGWIRVSVGTSDDLDRFERAMDSVL